MIRRKSSAVNMCQLSIFPSRLPNIHVRLSAIVIESISLHWFVQSFLFIFFFFFWHDELIIEVTSIDKYVQRTTTDMINRKLYVNTACGKRRISVSAKCCIQWTYYTSQHHKMWYILHTSYFSESRSTFQQSGLMC